MPTTRPFFLNAAVKATVMADLTLWAMWVTTRDTYDDEIEPLHNASWVSKAEAKEAEHLEFLQGKLSQAKAEFDAR